MGAPLREWVLRTIVALALMAAGAMVAFVPAYPPLRVAAIAIGSALMLDQAFRRLPSFDPLARIRWRLQDAPTRAKRCAITFDDGPSAATGQVLDILAAESVPATFFVLGGNVERFPAVVQRAQADGHAIGLHGMDHTKLNGATVEAVEAQVGGLMRLLHGIGVSPSRLYRTPHGFKSRSVFAVARRHQLTLWAWTRGIWDTDRPDPAVLVQRATRYARSGMVLLLHDGRGDERQPDVSSMVTALPLILRELKRRGFAFVRLTDV